MWGPSYSNDYTQMQQTRRRSWRFPSTRWLKSFFLSRKREFTFQKFLMKAFSPMAISIEPVINSGFRGAHRGIKMSLCKSIMMGPSLSRGSLFQVLYCFINVIHFYHARKNFWRIFRNIVIFFQKIISMHFPFLKISMYVFSSHVFRMYF